MANLLKKFALSSAIAGIGLAIVLVGLPGHTEESNTDLDNYTEEQLEAYFEAELDDAEAQFAPEEEYSYEQVEQALLTALSNQGDAQDSEEDDDVITQENLSDEIPWEEVERIIEEEIEAVDSSDESGASLLDREPVSQFSMRKTTAGKQRRPLNQDVAQALKDGRLQGKQVNDVNKRVSSKLATAVNK